ncbi:CKLF-like MARVEL transmembrane domain-containing protein 5 isoform X2 [Anser cygnoides]|uniref:CKLF-like MARVEL transmembrane domain-containing protein 5 isoform X2 n=1 Tax=Anser cygnoides TaxID=8845 RepID=UPI0034D323E5
MGQPQAQGLWDLGVLRTPKGRLLGAQLALGALLLALLAPAAPTLGPALLQALGAAALGGASCARPPPCPTAPACGVAVSLLVALVAIAGSRQALPVATFTFGLILALLFAYDAFATFRDDVRPLAACDPPEATTT